MPTHQSEMFVYDNIYFENGRRDQHEHPVIIAGIDEDNVYCFAMTSQTKHLGKNSQIRNLYNSTIKYAESIPGKNCTTNNFIRGLVNTTNCFSVPKERAREYAKFGFASPKLLEEIIVKWAYQQNEIIDRKPFNYNQICNALGVSDSIKLHPLYRQCDKLMQDYPGELQVQRKYAEELRKYREECLKIKRQNTNNYYRGIPPLAYPKEPRLEDDKSFYEQYSTIQMTEEERIASSPFAGLAEQLFGSNETKEEQATKPSNVIDFEAKKKELLELKHMLQETQTQEQAQEQETHHGRRAA